MQDGESMKPETKAKVVFFGSITALILIGLTGLINPSMPIVIIIGILLLSLLSALIFGLKMAYDELVMYYKSKGGE